MKMTTIPSDRYQQDEVLSAVLWADSVLLFCHVSPDGDTLGSALALQIRLSRMGKSAWVMLDGTVPENLSFLPGADSVLKPGDPVPACSLALSVDVSSRDRLGGCESVFAAFEHTALVDHHGTNEGFAALNCIDGETPATALVVFRLFQRMNLPVNLKEAVCLYTALATDTGNFIYENTNAECFAMMSALLDAGLPLSQYSRLLFRQKEEPFVRLLGEVLPSLRVTHEGKIAGLCCTLAQMKRAGANGGHHNGVVDYAIDIKGVCLAYYAREQEDGRTKVSLRALAPYAVDEIAARFGGGGHKLAAGLTLDVPLEQAPQVMEAALETAL